MPRANRRDLSFASFNLYNLSAPGQLTYGTAPAVDPESAEDLDALERKLDWTAQALLEADAEVFGFQEVWSVEMLREAFRRAGLEGDYDFVLRDAPAKGKPQVGAAIRRGEDGESQIVEGSKEWIASFPGNLPTRRAARDLRQR